MSLTDDIISELYDDFVKTSFYKDFLKEWGDYDNLSLSIGCNGSDFVVILSVEIPEDLVIPLNSEDENRRYDTTQFYNNIVAPPFYRDYKSIMSLMGKILDDYGLLYKESGGIISGASLKDYDETFYVTYSFGLLVDKKQRDMIEHMPKYWDL